jgi:hypothetical protein
MRSLISIEMLLKEKTIKKKIVRLQIEVYKTKQSELKDLYLSLSM